MIVVCRSADPEQARCRALEEVRKIGCENLFYRSDIGMKALSFLVKNSYICPSNPWMGRISNL